MPTRSAGKAPTPKHNEKTGEIAGRALDVVEIDSLEVMTSWDEVARILTTPHITVHFQAEDDNETLAAAIAADIIASDDPLAQLVAITSKDMGGGPFKVKAARVLASRFGEETKGIFFACQCETMAGKAFVMSTSALNVMAAITAFAKRDKLPVNMRLEKTTTAGGYDVLRAVHTKWVDGTKTKLDALLDAKEAGVTGEYGGFTPDQDEAF